MGWRLFKRFQQGVKAVVRQHVHLVDQIDFVAGMGRRVLHVFQQLTGVLDLCLGRGIDFNQVNRSTLGNFRAGPTLTTRCRSDASVTVETLGENTRNGGLAHAAGACKQVSMMESPGFQRVHQRLQHMLLPDHLGEVAGSPFSGENLMRHARPSAIKGGDSDSHTPAPESVTTVAPFRAWRGSSLIAARGPSESPQNPP